jgi:hypothetical protein
MCCVCLSFVSGCATILSHGNKTLPIISNPEGANVEIKDSRMDKIISKNTTPFQATFERGDGYFLKKKYILDLSKEGYISEKVEVSPSFNFLYIGNILFGGLIGILIVDPLTGDMWQYYLDKIDVKLFPNTPEGQIAREESIKEKLAKEAKEEEERKQQMEHKL